MRKSIIGLVLLLAFASNALSFSHRGNQICDVENLSRGYGPYTLNCYFYDASIEIQFSNGGHEDIDGIRMGTGGDGKTIYLGYDKHGNEWKVVPHNDP